MIKLLETNEWKLDNTITDDNIVKLIENSNELFCNFGGDIEAWLLHIKIEHGVRIFGKHPKYRKIIIMNDLVNGLTEFKNVKLSNETYKRSEKEIMQYMYC